MNRGKEKRKHIIEFSNPPHWYSQYSWSPVPDDAEDFFGREIELLGFWDQMTKLTRTGCGTKTNYAFVGQRKLGKTAYLKRCYNIAFWEQDEVVPFYYSFSQQDGNDEECVIQISDLQVHMPREFLRQFFAYCTKDQAFLRLNSCEKIIDYARKLKFPELEELADCIHNCLNDINNSHGSSMMFNIWQFTQKLSFFVGKKCLLIIDEAQEMETSIYYNGECCSCKSSIADIIQKHHSLVFVSGSNVSMLVNNFLDYSFSNRISQFDFTPLEVEDAKKLIQKRCPSGYKKLADDLLELVGGNPYYIDIVLGFNMKYNSHHKQNKDFSSRQGLLRAYDFEVLNPKGEIYLFWRSHLRKNKKDLNHDPKGKKGLTLQLLYKISSNPHKNFTYNELAKEFSVKEDTIEVKLEQLIKANLIEPTNGVGFFAHAFPDKVLPVIINNAYHKLIIEGPSESVAQKALVDYNAIINACEKKAKQLDRELQKASKRFAKVKKKFLKTNFELAQLDKEISSALGKLYLQKGMHKENKIRKKVRRMITNKQHLFANCQLQGDVHSINITSSAGTGCQIDIYAKLRENNNKEFALLAEVKNHKNKVGIAAARKFVASVKRAKEEYKLKNVVAVYISVNGFSKNAQQFLQKHDIKTANSEQVFIS